jgi:hypothetical protein
MQLRFARLCLDCEEVHDAQRCPACASESFAYLSRWVQLPDSAIAPRRRPEAPADVERLDAIRGLAKGRVLTGSVVGITTLGLLGWWWQRRGRPGTAADQEGTAGSDR